MTAFQVLTAHKQGQHCSSTGTATSSFSCYL